MPYHGSGLRNRGTLHGADSGLCHHATCFQRGDAGVQGTEVAAQTLITQPQEAELSVRAGTGAVAQGGAAALQRVGHVEEALQGGSVRQFFQRFRIV